MHSNKPNIITGRYRLPVTAGNSPQVCREGVSSGAEGVSAETEGVSAGADGVSSGAEGVCAGAEGVSAEKVKVKWQTGGRHAYMFYY